MLSNALVVFSLNRFVTPKRGTVIQFDALACLFFRWRGLVEPTNHNSTSRQTAPPKKRCIFFVNNEIGNVSIFTGRPLKKELRVLFMSPFETSQLHIFLFKDSQPSTGPPTTCARSETPTTSQGDKYVRGEGP